jgi:hypothetical protein
MGWTGIYHIPDNPVEFLTKELTWVGDDGDYCKVLAASPVGSTVYMAMERKGKDDAKPYVFAMVVLTQRHDGEFMYKEMDESTGPNECNCPDKIMNLLTPLEEWPDGPHEYAVNWRRRVAEAKEQRTQLRHKKARIQVGMVIELPEPASFGAYGRHSKFRVVAKEGTRLIFVPTDSNFRCRLTQNMLAKAVIQQEGQ